MPTLAAKGSRVDGLPRIRERFIAPDDLLARQVLFLWMEQTNWIVRRVEKFTFVDHGRYRRSVSVDFVVPPLAGSGNDLLDEPDGTFSTVEERAVILPVATMEKGPLRNFNLVDDCGRSLPLVSKAHNTRIVSTFLDAASAGGVSPEIVAQIVGGSPNVAEHLWTSEVAASGIAAESAMLFGPFVHGYLLLARFAGKPGDRRIIKFSTDVEPTPSVPEIGLWGRFARIVGEFTSYSAQKTEFDAPGAFAAASYHVEVVTPDEMLLQFAALHSRDQNDLLSYDQPSGGTGRAHVYCSAGEVSEFEDAPVVTVMARLHWAGPLLASVIMSFALGTMLAGGWLLADSRLTRSDETASSLVVGLLGLLALFLGRDREDPLVTRASWGPRGVLLLGGLVALLAAATLGVEGTTSLDYRWLAGIISGIFVVIAIVRSRRRFVWLLVAAMIAVLGVLDVPQRVGWNIQEVSLSASTLRAWVWGVGGMLLLGLGILTLPGLKRSVSLWRQPGRWWKPS